MIDCPDVHLTINSAITRGFRVYELLNSRVNNNIRRSRKHIISKKVLNVAHFSSLFANLSLGGLGQELPREVSSL